MAVQDEQKVYEMTDVEREFFKTSTIFKRLRLLPECTPEESKTIGTILNKAFDKLIHETRLPEGKESDGHWEYLEMRKHNVKIYRKASEDQPIKCVKAVAEVEGYSLSQIFDFLLSWDFAFEYDKSLIVGFVVHVAYSNKKKKKYRKEKMYAGVCNYFCCNVCDN